MSEEQILCPKCLEIGIEFKTSIEQVKKFNCCRDCLHFEVVEDPFIEVKNYMASHDAISKKDRKEWMIGLD